MKYRAEIDGLRALAVVPVILFHAGFELFSGGFVGVDVFFVISGYLITTILIEDIENNRFSILSFYERRARRILPALFFVMLFCIPFAWMWMLPSQMQDFSQSLVAVSLFVSNILFWRESGYWVAAVDEKPLLHTWSLAIEEQYYVLFPIFLFLTWRYGKNRVFWMIVILAAISFTISEWGWRNKPSANFYLAPTRAWELFAGSITAFFVQKRGVQANNALSLIGLALIVFAIFSYDEFTPFPSVYALVPVVGVVLLVLYADTQTFTAKLLSTKGFVGIGLISYSAYLLHQPIFAFTRVFFDGVVASQFMVGGVILSIILAYVSWKYIEKPFRNKSIVRARSIWISSVTGILFFIAIGLLGHYQNGFGYRVVLDEAEGKDVLAKAILSEWKFSGYPTHPRMLESRDGYNKFGDGEEAVVMLGDSHSYQYWYAFGDLIVKQPEVFNDKTLYVKFYPYLPEASDLKLPKKTSVVVLNYYWSLLYRSPSVNSSIRCCGRGPGGTIGSEYEPFTPDDMDHLDLQLTKFISSLQDRGVKVILILDSPFGEEINPKSLVNIKRGFGVELKLNELAHVELSRDDALRRSEPVRERLMKISEKLSLQIIDPISHLCDGRICPKLSDSGYLLYKDYDHLSLDAVKSNASYIYTILN